MREINSYLIPNKLVKNVFDIVRNYESICEIPIDKIESHRNNFYEFLGTTTASDTLEDIDGIIAFRYELGEDLELREKILLSSAIFHLVNSSLYKPSLEPKRNLPYTTYKASAENPEKLRMAGIKFYSPDQKLGYHNDVFFDGEKYSIPKYVSLTNLFIGYSDPGNFYYVNQGIWNGFNELFERGEGMHFRFKVTPVVRESDLQKEIEGRPAESWSMVPVFWRDSQGSKFVFSNGELIDNENSTIIEDLKLSLLNNPIKLGIPQTDNQVIVFRNDIGFHSRDIFKGQFVHEGTTRLFLRAVSEQSIDVP